MGCFLKYICLGLDSSMKDQVGILGVSHFCTWHETIRSQRNIHPSNHLALFSSPIANTQYSVLEGSSMKRSHVTQSVHMMMGWRPFLRTSQCVSPPDHSLFLDREQKICMALNLEVSYKSVCHWLVSDSSQGLGGCLGIYMYLCIGKGETGIMTLSKGKAKKEKRNVKLWWEIHTFLGK